MIYDVRMKHVDGDSEHITVEAASSGGALKVAEQEFESYGRHGYFAESAKPVFN